MSIGPSWPFTIGLMIFALLAVVYFFWMLSLLKNSNVYMHSIAVTLILTNITCLMMGILGNPGLPQSLVDRLLKERFAKPNEGSEDMESGKGKGGYRKNYGY